MKKLQTAVRFPADSALLIRKLTDLFREHAERINSLTFLTELDALTDVEITAPTVGQVLKFDGTVWYNDTVSGGGGGGDSYFPSGF